MSNNPFAAAYKKNSALYGDSQPKDLLKEIDSVHDANNEGQPVRKDINNNTAAVQGVPSSASQGGTLPQTQAFTQPVTTAPEAAVPPQTVSAQPMATVPQPAAPAPAQPVMAAALPQQTTPATPSKPAVQGASVYAQAVNVAKAVEAANVHKEQPAEGAVTEEAVAAAPAKPERSDNTFVISEPPPVNVFTEETPYDASGVDYDAYADGEAERKANPYLENAVMTASPQQLVLMLYDGAIRFMNQAIIFINAKKLGKAHEASVRAQDIFWELLSTLEGDNEVTEGLKSLYTFLIQNLVSANVKKEADMYRDCIVLTREMRDTWAQAMELAVKGSNSGGGAAR